MATTAGATARGFFDEGDGCRRPARATLTHDGLAIMAAEGEPIVLWKPVDLVRTMGLDGFRISAGYQAGAFVFDPESGGELIRALGLTPDAAAPMPTRNLVSTMVIIVVLALTALVVLARVAFWLAERFF